MPKRENPSRATAGVFFRFRGSGEAPPQHYKRFQPDIERQPLSSQKATGWLLPGSHYASVCADAERRSTSVSHVTVDNVTAVSVVDGRRGVTSAAKRIAATSKVRKDSLITGIASGFTVNEGALENKA